MALIKKIEHVTFDIEKTYSGEPIPSPFKVFILEDEEIKIEKIEKYIKMKYPNAEFITSKTSTGALQLLNQHQPFNLLMLDYDLGSLNNKIIDTGLKVAKYITDKNIGYYKCFIHSMNYAGAKKMFQELDVTKTSILQFSMFEPKYVP